MGWGEGLGVRGGLPPHAAPRAAPPTDCFCIACPPSTLLLLLWPRPSGPDVPWPLPQVAALHLTPTPALSHLAAPADYIFASVWGHKVYTIYSILFIVFIILIIVTAFITIALTYFQLAVEDHR